MTGWTTITFETKENSDYPPSKWDGNSRGDSRADLHAVLSADNDAPDAENNHLCAYGRHLYVYNGGDRDWAVDEQFLTQLSGYWKRAVVCQADDTSDTGEARLYENDDGTVTQVDQYVELQGTDGDRGGKMACAYMMAEHGIDAFPRPPNMLYVREEPYNKGTDNYSLYVTEHVDFESHVRDQLTVGQQRDHSFTVDSDGTIEITRDGGVYPVVVKDMHTADGIDVMAVDECAIEVRDTRGE